MIQYFLKLYWYVHVLVQVPLNPSNAKATFVHHVGIHWIALIEHSQINTHVPGFS